MTTPPTVALLPAGETIEDYLDPLGLRYEDFRETLTGGWLFGYADALRLAGVRSVVVSVSREVRRPEHGIHRPTGATMWRLPQPRVNALLHRAGRFALPYDRKEGAPILRRALRSPARHLAWVLSTPVRALGALLRHEGCEAVLCQDYEQPRFDACVLVGSALGIPVVGSFQGAVGPSSPLEWPVRPRTMRAAAGVVAGSRVELERVARRYGLPPDRLAHIFNPLAIETWRLDGGARARARAELGLPADAWVVGWHGRVEIHKKGLDVLLDAWQRLTAGDARENAVLLLTGTGKDAGELRRRIAGRHLAGVQWLDEFVLDHHLLARRLAAADVYAFPSRLEGFPVAPVEAMACGLPVVAAAAHGIPDIFDGGEASGGVVVPMGDPAAFTAALSRLRLDRRLSHELGRRARRRVEAAFSPAVVGRQLRDVLVGPRPADG